MTLKLWTVSYDGRSAGEIVGKLRDNGIERVVHIGTVARDLEGSSLEGRLSEELRAAGIDFQHVEGVGEPPEFRGIAADRGREELTAAFNDYLSRRSYEMDRLRQLAEERPTAILCFLPGEQACEGSVIIQLLQREGTPIKNL
ncbi:MAG: DUF488 family protein [Methanomassiliicoccus sp.]|nr:DUF488 family protein [Methanomassiliicoccus sp.]